MNTENICLKNGVSGIMRIKNDAKFILPSVLSCIDALDELVIVWNDCSDNSEEEIHKVKDLFPDKVKIFEYYPKVYSINLSKEEYEYVKSLPNDSPHLLCNYYNFALSKVTYNYALKIDADQIYYTEKLKYWCDVYRGGEKTIHFSTVLGYVIWCYSKLVNRINLNKTRIQSLIKQNKNQKIWKCYIDFVAYKASHGSPVSLSGVDVVLLDKWYVTLGRKNDVVNILPPYNGVGDHLIFKVSPNTYYRPDDCKFYNELRSDNYSYIEWFEHDGGREYSIGPCWFHINSMRKSAYFKIKEVISKFPDSIMPISVFAKSDYNSVVKPLMDKAMYVQYQDNLFQFIHQLDSHDIIDNIEIINSLKI